MRSWFYSIKWPSAASCTLLLGSGAAAGFASGLLGVGGGTVVTPLLAMLTDLPQVRCSASSVSYTGSCQGAPQFTAPAHTTSQHPFCIISTQGLLGRLPVQRIQGMQMKIEEVAMALPMAE